MVRDEELNRLIRYAQGMGVSVHFKPYIKGSKTLAYWTTDGSEIVVYFTSRCSKIEKIMSLIHELGHHKAFVNNEREMDPRIEEALGSVKHDKLDRKRILDMEASDTKYWEDIYRDTNCQFNIDILRRHREFDIWCYEVYYKTGRDAFIKEKRTKMKKLRKKYGC